MNRRCQRIAFIELGVAGEVDDIAISDLSLAPSPPASITAHSCCELRLSECVSIPLLIGQVMMLLHWTKNSSANLRGGLLISDTHQPPSPTDFRRKMASENIPRRPRLISVYRLHVRILLTELSPVNLALSRVSTLNGPKLWHKLPPRI
jgi:hypothetical protein